MTASVNGTGPPRSVAILAAALFVFAFLLACFPLACYDTWWHMANGREVVQGRGLPRTNLYSFTHPEYPVTPTHWLFGAGAYLVHALAGVNGLIVTKALAVAAAFMLAFSLARRRGAGGVAAAITVVVACLASRKRFLERPHIFTMLGLVGFAYLVERFRAIPRRQHPPRRHGQRHVHHGDTETRRKGEANGGTEPKEAVLRASVSPWLTVLLKRNWPLLAVPPLAALWANLHAGCLFGVGLVGLEAAGEAVSYLVSRSRRRSDDPAAAGARRRALLLAATALASGVAVMASPVGWGVYTYNLWHLRVGGVVRLVEFGWSTPLAKPLFYVLLLAGAAALAVGWRRVRPGDALVFTVFGALGVYAVRAVPNFAVVASPVVAVHVSSLWRRLRSTERLARPARLAERVPVAAVSVAALIVPFALHFSGRRDIGLGMTRGFFPVAAAGFVEREVESPRVFNDLVSGGYLAWRWYPAGRRIFIDGRTNAYPPDFFEELYGPGRNMTSGFVDRVFREHGISCALLVHYRLGNPFWPAFDLDRWAVVHADEVALVLVRRIAVNAAVIEKHETKLGPRGDAALSKWLVRRVGMNSGRASAAARRGDAEGSRRLELRSRRDALRAGAAAGRALYLEAASGEAVFDDHARARLRFRMGIRERLLGRPKEAAKMFHQALEREPEWIEAHVNLGLALLDCGKHDLARRELEWVLEGRPGMPEAVFGLARSLDELGRTDEAAARYREFIETDGARPRDINEARKRLDALKR